MVLKINDRIRVRKLEFFSHVDITLKYNALASTFAFQYYFNPDNIEHKEMSCIGHYHKCTIEHNNEVVITGQILSTSFRAGSALELAAISGYSLPGILEDCEISTPNTPVPTGVAIIPAVEVSPYQFDLLGLRQIVDQIVKPMGISYVIDPIVAARMEEPFEESTARPSQNIKAYLSELAAQKNILISHNQFGQLVFTQAPAIPRPFIHLTGDLPVTEMALAFNGQGMHSRIRVMEQADMDDANSSQSDQLNPYVINTVFRPKVIIQNSRGRGGSTRVASGIDDNELAGKNARAQELRNLQLTLKLDRWIINGKIIRPGMFISVLNSKVYLYKKSNWIIEEVKLTKTPKEETATLSCVLPEVYNGQEPTYLFQGINLH